MIKLLTKNLIVQQSQRSIVGSLAVNRLNFSSTVSTITTVNPTTTTTKERTITIEPPYSEQKHNDLGHYDIVINGGGIVGLTFLLNLQRNSLLCNKKILLIEQHNKPTHQRSIDQSIEKRTLSNRVSSLTEASRQCFESNGLWPEIDEYAKRISEMQIWSTSLRKAISFDTIDLHDKLKNVAYIVENSIILDALNRNLNHDQIIYSTNVVDIMEIDDQINLFTKSNGQLSKLTCSLLIGCDGYNSLVRQKSNLNYFNLALNQSGVVGTVSMMVSADDRNSISYQRFLPDRTVVALLPLTNEESSFVISTSKELAKKLVEMTDEEFVDQFNRLLSDKVDVKVPDFIKNLEQSIEKNLPIGLIRSTRHRTLPKVIGVQAKSRASFPLGFGTTLPGLVGGIGRESTNVNVAIIGDSAHRIHPLAGQGLNLGIGDAVVLSNCLNACLERGEQLFGRGDYRCPLEKERLKGALNEFEKARQLKLIAMLSTIHTMQDLFNCTPPILLNAFDHMNWIKGRMVAYANSI